MSGFLALLYPKKYHHQVVLYDPHMTQPYHAPAGELNPHQRSELASLQVPMFQSHLRRESTELAYLLGAWMGCTEVGGKPDQRISFASQDEREVALIKERVFLLTGKIPAEQHIDIHGTPYIRVVVHSEEIAAHFQRVTAYNSRVPWEHLGTEAEILHYLKGMFDHGGWIFTGSSAGIGINKIDGEYLLRDVARVFTKVGMLPLVHDKEVTSLRLKECTEWQTFADKVSLSIPERQQVVQTLASLPSFKNHFSVADYEAVRHLYAGAGWNPARIARHTGIPANSVRDWMVRGQKPPAVKRKEVIDAFAATMPNPEVMNLVYRSLGASSALAVECGRRAKPEHVAAFAREVASNYDLLYGNDERIAEILLGGWARTVS